ncbi:MAG: hypothetical protein ABL958_13795 [Bdellovibrionia bacterium]
MRNKCESAEIEPESFGCESVWFGNLDCLFRTSPAGAVLLKNGSVAHKILSCLSERRISKADLARRVWGVARYSDRLHDNVVYKSISRFRRETGVTAVANRGEFLAPGLVTVTWSRG